MNDDKKPETIQVPGSVRREQGPVDESPLKGVESPQGAETQIKITEELREFIKPTHPETLPQEVISQPQNSGTTKTEDANQTVQVVTPKLGNTATSADAKNIMAKYSLLDSIREKAMLVIKKFQRIASQTLS